MVSLVRVAVCIANETQTSSGTQFVAETKAPSFALRRVPLLVPVFGVGQCPSKFWTRTPINLARVANFDLHAQVVRTPRKQFQRARVRRESRAGRGPSLLNQ